MSKQYFILTLADNNISIMEQQTSQTESKRIKDWKAKEEERILRQVKTYKYTFTLLFILWICLIVYTLIVGVDHVMNSNTGLISIIFMTGMSAILYYRNGKRAKQILEKRERENKENTPESGQ